jgi:outer membrane lipoprotein SlyB
MQQPKPKKKSGQEPTAEDIAFSKRSGISLSDIMAQGGVTPSSVMNQIKKNNAYDVKMKSGNGARIAAILKQDPKMAARISVKPSGVTKEVMIKSKGKVKSYGKK